MNPATRKLREVHRRRKRRRELRDEPHLRGRRLTRRINLGLSLLHLCAEPGVPLTRDDIAAWCGCSDGAILWIEQRAIRKLRRALYLRADRQLRELIDSLLSPKSPTL